MVEGSEGRGGFEVRVIGGTKPGPVSDEEAGVEIGLQIGSARGETQVLEAPDHDPVHRLESVEPLRVKPMSTAGPADPYVPRGSRARRGATRWMVWMSVATCAVTVAAVGALMATRKNLPEKVRDVVPVKEVDASEAERNYFLVHSAEVAAKAEKILERYAAAGSVEEALPLVRDGERVRPRMMEHWTSWGSSPAFEKGPALEHFVLDETGRPALGLSGRKSDFSRFEACFVQEQGQLKLDWEASYGIGDVQVAELRTGKAVKDQMVRVVIRPGNFYTPEFPEAEFRSYQLLDKDGENFVWAFARFSTPVAALLEKEFNESSILLEKVRDLRATVQVSGPMGERVNLFLLTEMLHKGWVTP